METQSMCRSIRHSIPDNVNSDVPEWARLYVGYCYANGLMVGYDTGAFGADDGVTPAAACTVVLRYMDLPDTEWDYSTACQTAIGLWADFGGSCC